MTATKLHRRGAKAVLRKYASDRATEFERQQSQIAPVELANTGFGKAKANTSPT